MVDLGRQARPGRGAAGAARVGARGQRLSPGQPVPARRRPGSPLREGRIGLARLRRLDLHARSVAQRRLRPRVHGGAPVRAGAGHEDHARALARADEDVLGARRAVDEVPRTQAPLLPLDDEQALARQDEEGPLVALALVEPVGLAGVKDVDRIAHLRKLDRVALDDARGAELLARHPRRVAHVDREPPLGRGRQAVLRALHPRLLHHPFLLSPVGARMLRSRFGQAPLLQQALAGRADELARRRHPGGHRGLALAAPGPRVVGALLPTPPSTRRTPASSPVPDRYDAPPVVTWTMPSEPASAKPRRAALSVCEVTLTAG